MNKQKPRARHFSESSTCSEVSEDSMAFDAPPNFTPTRRLTICDPTRVGEKPSFFGNINNYKDRTWLWISSGGKTVFGNTIYEKDGLDNLKFSVHENVSKSKSGE